MLFAGARAAVRARSLVRAVSAAIEPAAGAAGSSIPARPSPSVGVIDSTTSTNLNVTPAVAPSRTGAATDSVPVASASAPSPAARMPTGSGSVIPEEIARFSELSSRWWDAEGPMAGLHETNPTRMEFVRCIVSQVFPDRPMDSISQLTGLRVLDVGCGAGIASESFARLGAEVVGVDATETNITAAQAHAALDARLSARLKYIYGTVETVTATESPFDMVAAFEVVEHTPDPEAFVRACAAAVRPGGLLFLSTLDRTLVSYALAITAAEHVLGLVPRGTHEWRRFLRPAELQTMVAAAGLRLIDTQGMVPRLGGGFQLRSRPAVNYLVAAQRPEA